jgi:hypothetical protein
MRNVRLGTRFFEVPGLSTLVVEGTACGCQVASNASDVRLICDNIIPAKSLPDSFFVIFSGNAFLDSHR